MQPTRQRRHAPVLITERDREILAFLACHRLAQAAHVAALLGIREDRAADVLARLVRGGYADRQTVFHQQPACYRVGRRGLAVIGSNLGAPGDSLREYDHDVGVTWLWLAARSGAFGPLRELYAERELRSHDEGPERSEPPLAVRLGGTGPGGRERLHYPDLLVRRADGRTIALELELTTKSRTRLERILAGYGADPRFDAVLYLVQNASTARSIITAAQRLAIRSLVHVQRVEFGRAGGRSNPARTIERTHARGSSALPCAPEQAR